MAHLVRQQKTYYVDAADKRVPRGTPGARKVREKQSNWSGVGIPGFPPKKRVPLASDKSAARRMLEDLVRRGEQGHAGLPDRDAGRKPLSDYLTAFEADVALGLATRGGKKQRVPSPAQVALTVQRVRDVLSGAGFAHPSDLGFDAPARLAKYLQGRARLARKDGGASAQTAAFLLAAARRFVRWLSSKAGVRADLFDPIPGFDPRGDRKHARRDATPEELARVLDAALGHAATVRGLTGTQRYYLYLTAFASGFRAEELSRLTPRELRPRR